jgi:hypothetical protein
MAQHTVYTCDLCDREMHREYHPDSSNGLVLLFPWHEWQRVRLTDGRTCDICAVCTRLIERTQQLGITYPWTIKSALLPKQPGDTARQSELVSENAVREILGLPMVHNPAEIISNDFYTKV